MEPIIALATSPIKSAIHVIRLSGDNVIDMTASLFSKPLDKDKNINIGYLKHKNKIIDQVVILIYHKPHSYTGEDVVEIMSHGNSLIDNEIINAYISLGARLAANGEFTSRAFLNKKIDLIQAEAVNDIVNATSKESKEIITYALKGETSNLLIPIKTKLLDLISNLEVNIDYPEYQDIEVVNKKRIDKELKEHQKIIKNLIKDGEKGLTIKNGVNLAIIGKPNVGKSTLLNALLKEDKAIVSNIPGTTRDVVEGDVNIDGITFHLLDTAGIRKTKNKIEKLGMNKTLKIINKADIIIYLKENENEMPIIKNSKAKIIEIISKGDLYKQKKKNLIYISAKKGDIYPLLNKLKLTLGIEEEIYQHPSFANARELGLLEKANKLIDSILLENKNDTPIDIIATLITDLLNIILEIYGEKASLDITKEIFSRFCVGK